MVLPVEAIIIATNANREKKVRRAAVRKRSAKDLRLPFVRGLKRTVNVVRGMSRASLERARSDSEFIDW